MPPGTGDNKQLHKLSQIMVKMTRTAVFPKFHDPIGTCKKLTFFNLEKYNWILEKITKIMHQMTKTGFKE